MSKKRGKAQRLGKCCREIRIQAGCMVLNGIYTGFNTLTDEPETWICIKVNKDQNKNVLQRVID